MESIGSAFFLILLIIGIVFIIKKSKKIGFLFIGISIIFLFMLPEIKFNKYKKSTYGIYKGSNEQKIIIENGKYKIFIAEKLISSGNVEYSNIDDYSFYLGEDQNFESRNENQIRNSKNVNEILYKQ